MPSSKSAIPIGRTIPGITEGFADFFGGLFVVKLFLKNT